MHRIEGLDSNPQTHKLDNVKAVACVHACMHAFQEYYSPLMDLSRLVKSPGEAT